MKSNKIVFIDSDGTVMDSMLIKHEQALAPSLIEAFKLDDIKDVILHKWFQENIYEITRGLNRFDALLSILKYLDSINRGVPYLASYEAWLNSTTSKSLNDLKRYIAQNNLGPMPEVIRWGELVTEKMEATKELIKPFKSVDLALEQMSKKFRVIIVSTANKSSLEHEWGKYGFLQYADEICSQEVGTKLQCIKHCLEKYKPECAVMIGDSMLDYKAAKANNIFFYPILQNKEKDCWDEWMSSYENKLYDVSYQEVNDRLVKRFFEALNYKG